MFHGLSEWTKLCQTVENMFSFFSESKHRSNYMMIIFLTAKKDKVITDIFFFAFYVKPI